MFDPVLIVVNHMSELRQLSLAETDISSLSLAKFIPEGSMYLRTNDRQFEFCLHIAFDGLAHTSTISSSGVYFSSPNAVLTSVLAILSVSFNESNNSLSCRTYIRAIEACRGRKYFRWGALLLTP